MLGFLVRGVKGEEGIGDGDGDGEEEGMGMSDFVLIYAIYQSTYVGS